MDVFAEHGVGGIIGHMCCALFGADYITALDVVTYITEGLGSAYVYCT